MRAKGKAFAWQSKATLRRVREAFDATGDITSGLAVYVALSEIASDRQCDRFQASQGYIAQKAGLHARTVRRRLKTLLAIGVIKIETPDPRVASYYELTDPKERGHDALPGGHNVLPGGHGVSPNVGTLCPTVEESLEESPEQGGFEKSRTGKSAFLAAKGELI